MLDELSACHVVDLPRHLTIIIGAVLCESLGDTGEVVAALGVALGALEGREGDEDHQEDKAGDGEYEHDLDDGKAPAGRVLLIAWIHRFLSKLIIFIAKNAML